MQDGRAVPDAIIDQLFGKGLGYSDWEREITRQGFRYNENLENQIIKREFSYFKPEILFLEAQENTATGRRSPKTNSLESILKRIKGEKWSKKMPDEKAERLRDGRLFGRDAK
jgi:hypothetical protein